MADKMTVADLIEKLKEKDQSLSVQFIVVTDIGAVLAVNFSNQAKPVAKVLKMIGDDNG